MSYWWFNFISNLSQGFQSGRFRLDSVKPFLIFCVLSPNSPNIHSKDIQGIFNTINLSLSLIMNLPLDSSPCFYKENWVFSKKKFSSLVFRDDFSFNGIRRMSNDLFCFWAEKWHQNILRIMRKRLSRSPWRCKKCGYLLILSVGLIRKFTSHRIL